MGAKTKDCIFMGYAKRAKVEIFEHIRSSQQVLSRETIVGSMKLNAKPISRPIHGYHDDKGNKDQAVEAKLKQVEEDH